MIQEYLEDASDKALRYGTSWSEINCPDSVRRIVAAAVARFIRNPDGYAQSRAGDETLSWQELEEVGSVYFTPTEIEHMQRLGNPRLPSFGTIQMKSSDSAPMLRDIYVPVGYAGGRDFPLFRGY